MRVVVPSSLVQRLEAVSETAAAPVKQRLRRKPIWVAPRGDEPYFRPNSMFARVLAERGSYSALARMLLTQGSHPLVYKTFRPMAFAPRSETDRYLSVVTEMHGRVRGKLKYDGGSARTARRRSRA
jgi:hypothetical protein